MIKVGIVGGTGYTGVELLRILSEERHTCVLITHDVGVVADIADRVIGIRDGAVA